MNRFFGIKEELLLDLKSIIKVELTKDYVEIHHTGGAITKITNDHLLSQFQDISKAITNYHKDSEIKAMKIQESIADSLKRLAL